MSKLEIARIMKGYNQTKFAEAIGISRVYLSNIEHGKNKPSLRIVSSISKVLELPIAKVMKMLNI